MKDSDFKVKKLFIAKSDLKKQLQKAIAKSDCEKWLKKRLQKGIKCKWLLKVYCKKWLQMIAKSNIANDCKKWLEKVIVNKTKGTLLQECR